ncbi:hypothetical protein [Streptomyces purpureus]|uniref:Uncharacterized protein n=1 Tax=Streptomyces purpureus TaxID=1951 RepID=A0A918H4R5_9ACTN|nr:hypothetical protein [Streptomyces purpureus]GGT38609.1 hypothetical protein GCM10014713_35450 [Streptomyces purpureus]
MARTRHFHLDQGGHSVTVNVGPGRSGEIELLVNGKVIGYVGHHDTGTTVLTGELPEDPPRLFHVRVRQPRLAPLRAACVFEMDGVERPMSERSVV